MAEWYAIVFWTHVGFLAGWAIAIISLAGLMVYIIKRRVK